MAATDPFTALNTPQRRAVTFGQPLADGKGVQSGPLLVVAGAGTGKTETIAHRAAWLAMNGVDPARILLLTFTRRAAGADAPARARHHARHARRHARQQGAGDAAAAGLGRHLSFDRQPPAAPLRAPPQSRAQLHGDRSRRFGRSVRQPAPGTEAERAVAALSAQGHLPGDLLLAHQHAKEPARDARAAVQLVPELGAGPGEAVPRLRRAQAALRAARLRRPAGLLAGDDERAAPGAAGGLEFRPRAGR